MSQNDDLDPYYQSGEAGVEHANIDASGDGHPFGDEPKEWEARLTPLIRQVADDLYESWEATVREYLANAETACLKVERHLTNPDDSPFDDVIVADSYEPTIEVTWDKSEQKLIIQDNGIGMAAVEVDEVFRHIGRSAARDLGTVSGAFGMGSLSFEKFTGPNNSMVMLSHSRLNDDNAAYIITLAGVEPVMGTLDDDEYGTVFELDQKEEGMDVRQAVKRYAQWMRIPVLYEEYDENGTEVFNEDWGDKKLYDNYEEGIYADEFIIDGAFEAYMSESAEGETLLLSMEIDRNGGSQYTSPYDFDVRILDESGKVIRSTNGNEGLIPVARMEYEQMLLDARDGFITENLLSNQDVTAISYEGEEDYAIDSSVLESSNKLPVAHYIPKEEADPQLMSRGVAVVIAGPHKGRTVVGESEWNELEPGRAEQFVPEDELEEYDLDSDTGDLRLPKPTADRSKLQEHDTFWKYVARHFRENYDEAIDEWRHKLERSDTGVAAIKDMDSQTVADLRGGRNA